MTSSTDPKKALPKFGLDPAEWREIQRLRKEGFAYVDIVERHFLDETTLPSICIVTCPNETIYEVDDKTYRTKEDCPPLAQWMIDTGQFLIAAGL